MPHAETPPDTSLDDASGPPLLSATAQNQVSKERGQAQTTLRRNPTFGYGRPAGGSSVRHVDHMGLMRDASAQRQIRSQDPGAIDESVVAKR
jgi:hypothetical protein